MLGGIAPFVVSVYGVNVSNHDGGYNAIMLVIPGVVGDVGNRTWEKIVFFLGDPLGAIINAFSAYYPLLCFIFYCLPPDPAVIWIAFLVYYFSLEDDGVFFPVLREEACAHDIALHEIKNNSVVYQLEAYMLLFKHGTLQVGDNTKHHND